MASDAVVAQTLGKTVRRLSEAGINLEDMADYAGVEVWQVEAAMHGEMPALAPWLLVAAIRRFRMAVESIGS